MDNLSPRAGTGDERQVQSLARQTAPVNGVDMDNDQLLEESRFLRTWSCPNARELGGYQTPHGPTLGHRFLRTGGTRGITQGDLDTFYAWGVRRVLDLRSKGESPRLTCRFAKVDGIIWENVPLFDYDLSAPSMPPVRAQDNYLVTGYLHMLSSKDSIRRIFEFFAGAKDDECVLYHCAAGIDRTGVVSMLLLGLADVAREQVIADYGYSFGSVAEVNALVEHRKDAPPARMANMLQMRLDTISAVLDTVVHEHGSVRAYLASCDITEATLDAVRRHLLGA